MNPIIQAILLAERIYEDRVSRKMVIAGTFNNLFIPKKGASQKSRELEVEDGMMRLDPNVIIGSPMAYISLTEARGDTTLVLRYVDLSDQAVLFSIDIRFGCHDPLQTVEIPVQLPTLPAPHGGVYALELLHKGDLLGAHRINVIEVEDRE